MIYNMTILLVSLGIIATIALIIIFLNWRENKQAKYDKANEITTISIDKDKLIK